METIPTHLIKNALELTGMPYSTISNSIDGINWTFSIEKFFYYLLNPNFIERYRRVIHGMAGGSTNYSKDFGEAICEYQSGNSQQLINLLSKI